MTHNTRNFMVGSAAILVAGLGVGLVAFYGGISGTFASQSVPSELAYLPSNAAVVAYANVSEVMHSEMRDHLRSLMPDEDKEKGRKEFQEATGIDIEKDITSIVACLVMDGEDHYPVVAIRGTFDEGRIEALARQHGGTVDTSSGVRIISLPKGDHEGDAVEGDAPAVDENGAPRRMARGNFHPAMAFVESGLLLFGREEAVKAGARKTGQNLMSNADLMDRIGKIDRGANAWAVGRFDALTGNARLPEQVSSQIPPVTWFEAAGHVNGGLRGTLKAETKDATSAQNLRDMINGLMALGRMQAQSKPGMNALMQSIILGGKENIVELSFTVPAELMDAITPKAKVKTVAMR